MKNHNFNFPLVKQGIKIILRNLVLKFPSQQLRSFYLKAERANIGKNTVLYGSIEVWAPHKLTIGKNSSIGHRSILDARGGLKIGASVNISTEVWLWTAEHKINCPDFSSYAQETIIEDYVWLCGRCIIMPGVTIGKGAVVASGAIVTRSVAPFDIVAGIPAKKIGERSKDLKYKLASCIPFI